MAYTASEPTFAFNTRFTASERELLQQLQHAMRERSAASTVRRAIDLLATIVDLQEAGGTTHLTHPKKGLVALPEFVRPRPRA